MGGSGEKYLDSFWKDAEGRERKYYKLTPAGRAALAAKKKEWKQFVAGAQAILGGADGVA